MQPWLERQLSEFHIRRLAQRLTADRDQIGDIGSYKLSVAYEALDKQEHAILNLTKEGQHYKVYFWQLACQWRYLNHPSCLLSLDDMVDTLAR